MIKIGTIEPLPPRRIMIHHVYPDGTNKYRFADNRVRVTWDQAEDLMAMADWLTENFPPASYKLEHSDSILFAEGEDITIFYMKYA